MGHFNLENSLQDTFLDFEITLHYYSHLVLILLTKFVFENVCPRHSDTKGSRDSLQMLENLR